MINAEIYTSFQEAPLSAIRPEGWLRSYLDNQRHGLTGNIEHAGYPFDTQGWACPKLEHLKGCDWWPYEQTAFWVDGAIRCGHLLQDPFLISKAQRQIDYVLNNADSEGYLGPSHLKLDVNQHRWPHAVFFRAMMAHYSATNDQRIIAALARHYLSNTASHSDGLSICNLEVITWTYEKTGDKRLLNHALQAYDEFNRQNSERDWSLEALLSEKRATEHGFSYNAIARLGAIMYIHTANEVYLQASLNAYRKIERDHVLIDGVCSSTEALRGKDPLDAHETCNLAHYPWSLSYLLMVTGNAEYADRIERACFNAAPGAVRSDFKAVQYFSCPNQVIAAQNSNHTPFFTGNHWMSYRPNPGTECCAGNINRVLPNYVARMWLLDRNGGIVAALYGPSRITIKAGNPPKEVTVVEETNYPFSEHIDFHICCKEPVEFPLVLRIPGWCEKAQILVNHKPINIACKPGIFITLSRIFEPNDRVTLVLPMELRLSQWPRGGIGVERGPIVFALRIEEDWQVVDSNEKNEKVFPSWNLYPKSPWNYALDLGTCNLEDSIEIVHRPMSNNPWILENAPIELRVPARRVIHWEMDQREHVVDHENRIVPGPCKFTPQLPDPSMLKHLKEKEKVRLVPYGCTHLRISVFPKCQ